MARAPAEVEKNLALLERLKATEASQLEAAQTSALKPETKERLQKIKSLMDRFSAGVEEIAKAQTTLLAQIDKRTAISGEWTKAIDTELASPVLARMENRAEIEKLLHQADAKVNSLRAAIWRFGATGDASLVASMERTQAALKEILDQAGTVSDDKELQGVIGSLEFDRQAFPRRQ